jgi:hypothetical protein
MKTLIITMDPGAHKIGLAAGWVLPEGQSEPLFAVTLDVKTNLRGYARASLVARTALAALVVPRTTLLQDAERILLVVEAMQSDSRTAGGVVADILDCQATGGAFASLMEVTAPLKVRTLSPTPGEWVKGMSKDVMRRQLADIWPNTITSKTGHDAVSAAGLFRWALPHALFG